jgi:hypothetical protein
VRRLFEVAKAKFMQVEAMKPGFAPFIRLACVRSKADTMNAASGC